MASQAKRRQRSSSPAARRQRQPPRQTAQQKRQVELEEMLGIAVGWAQNLEAQRAQLDAQRKRVEEQIEDVNGRLNQAVGRVETLQEMLGLKDPLPALALPAVEDAKNGDKPADEGENKG